MDTRSGSNQPYHDRLLQNNTEQLRSRRHFPHSYLPSTPAHRYTGTSRQYCCMSRHSDKYTGSENTRQCPPCSTDLKYSNKKTYMSRLVGKPTICVSDKVRHKPACTSTENSLKLEILDLSRRGIVLSENQKQRR